MKTESKSTDWDFPRRAFDFDRCFNALSLWHWTKGFHAGTMCYAFWSLYSQASRVESQANSNENINSSLAMVVTVCAAVHLMYFRSFGRLKGLFLPAGEWCVFDSVFGLLRMSCVCVRLCLYLCVCGVFLWFPAPKIRCALGLCMVLSNVISMVNVCPFRLMHKRVSIQLLYNTYFPVPVACFIWVLCQQQTFSTNHFVQHKCVICFVHSSLLGKTKRNVIFFPGMLSHDMSDLQKKLIHAGLCANFEIDTPKIATKSNQFVFDGRIPKKLQNRNFY